MDTFKHNETPLLAQKIAHILNKACELEGVKREEAMPGDGERIISDWLYEVKSPGKKDKKG